MSLHLGHKRVLLGLRYEENYLYNDDEKGEMLFFKVRDILLKRQRSFVRLFASVPIMLAFSALQLVVNLTQFFSPNVSTHTDSKI